MLCTPQECISQQTSQECAKLCVPEECTTLYTPQWCLTAHHKGMHLTAQHTPLVCITANRPRIHFTAHIFGKTYSKHFTAHTSGMSYSKQTRDTPYCTHLWYVLQQTDQEFTLLHTPLVCLTANRPGIHLTAHTSGISYSKQTRDTPYCTHRHVPVCLQRESTLLHASKIYGYNWIKIHICLKDIKLFKICHTLLNKISIVFKDVENRKNSLSINNCAIYSKQNTNRPFILLKTLKWT